MFILLCTRNMCVSVGSISPGATRSIVKLGQSNMGSSWNRPVANELTGTHMRECGVSAVFQATLLSATGVVITHVRWFVL